jgi:hypothetical protein
VAFLQRANVGGRGKTYDERNSVGKKEWTEIEINWINNNINS